MKVELLERTFAAIANNPENVMKGHARVKEHYERQDSFSGWDKYKSRNGGWGLCAYDTGRIVPIDDRFKERRNAAKAVRYALYRAQTFANAHPGTSESKLKKMKPPASIMKLTEGPLESVVAISLGGIQGFAIKWDVDPIDPTKCYARGESVEKQWEQEVVATDLPS